MKNVWVDLTDLFEWKGHFTGIQRVTYNYAVRFHEKGAKFFVYSNLYNRFVELPFSLVEELKRLDELDEPTTKRQEVKRTLRAKYKSLPKPLRRISSPVLGRANKVFRKGAALVLDGKGRNHQLRKLPTVVFASNDTVLLLGAGWNSGKLIDKLAIQKTELDLKIVLHLNDILPIYQPHLFAKELPKLFSNYVHKALPVASMVTVISEATKHDVLRYAKEHNVQPPIIEVIRLGEDITTAQSIKPDVALSNDFVLCVGTLEIRKNYSLLYQALKLAQSEGKDLPQIVIAGRKGWLTHDLQYTIEHDPAVANKIVILEKMSDANLSWLYENCQFTVFCSIAEGWGLPIAESLQHGKFCLSSNTSSMPEIAGDTIDYFNPFDTRECMEKIADYAGRDIAQLNRDTKANYKVFSWDDSFEQFGAIIQKT